MLNSSLLITSLDIKVIFLPAALPKLWSIESSLVSPEKKENCRSSVTESVTAKISHLLLATVLLSTVQDGEYGDECDLIIRNIDGIEFCDSTKLRSNSEHPSASDRTDLTEKRAKAPGFRHGDVSDLRL